MHDRMRRRLSIGVFLLAAGSAGDIACHHAVTATPPSLDRLTTACAANDAHACYLAAERWRTGEGTPADPATAVMLYDRACRLGDPVGCYDFASALSDGDGIAADRTRAAATFERGCKLGDDESCKARRELDAK